jgi:DNA-binding CsgD family transcriptional regulator
LAAQEAINLGAHKQAAAHYQAMLECIGELETTAKAGVYDALSYELYLTAQIQKAIQYQEAGLGIWQQHARFDKEGPAWQRLSRYNWLLGERELAIAYSKQAIESLEKQKPNAELATAYSLRAHLHILHNDIAQAIFFAEKALDLSKQLGAADAAIYASIHLGTALWVSGNETGLYTVQQNLTLAREHHLPEYAAVAYTNIVVLAIAKRQYDLAERYFEEGLEYCDRHDLDLWSWYMSGWSARLRFEQGQWNQAQQEASQVLSRRECPSVIRQPSILALACVAVREGDPKAAHLLDQAKQLATQIGDTERLLTALVAEAELAWLNGTLLQVLAPIKTYLDQPDVSPWTRGALAYWLWRGSESVQAPRPVAEPYLLQMQGNWQLAAQLWAALGCPYEQALALADGDEDAEKTALSILEKLGAGPAVHWLREKMRAEGVRGLPRGPRAETRKNPCNLTRRQMEVLQCIVAGHSDAEIADRLHISAKTAGHHVSAILSKLDARSRQEAAVQAVHQGWIVPEETTATSDSDHIR